MHIALFLHIYQPPTQYPKMLRRITRQSYERLVTLLSKFPKAKITLNITASLTQQLVEAGFAGLLGEIKLLAERGQIEFTGSAAYHPILPDLSKSEIIRQIKLNSSINHSLFGSAYQPAGFFSPELAYEPIVGEVVEKLGFRWILVDGSAVLDWRKMLSLVYTRRGGKLLVFPREESLSFRIAFGRVRTMVGFLRAIGRAELVKNQYLVLAMDGETFGHHQPRQLAFLEALFARARDDRNVQLVTVSELVSLYPERKPVDVLPSTWGYTEMVGGEKVWVRWRNPGNPLHGLLSELRFLAIAAAGKEESGTREVLDKALSSDTFWWASGKPFWNPGMVKRGADLLLRAVSESSLASEEAKRRAQGLYRQITTVRPPSFMRKKQ